MRKGLIAVVVGAMVVVAAVFVGVKLTGRNPLDAFAEPGCVADVDGHRVELDLEQSEHASLIAAISVQRGLPARAASIALATAYQESDLRNLDHGDRDSVGLFQQRPSQGWGTVEELTDPVYATNAFYDVLAEVEGYRSLEITDAAQTVQRSGYPEAYADHEDDARALSSAFTGYSPGGFACDVPGDADEASDNLTPSGLTPRARDVRDDIESVFGDLALGGFAPGGVQDGHQEGSTHYEGRAVDVFFRPVNPDNKRAGWSLASYLVAHADRLDVQTVIFDDRIWRAGTDDSWRDYDPPGRSGDPAILEHRDHVHVDVFD